MYNQDLKTEASYLARRDLSSQVINTLLSLGIIGVCYATVKLPYEYKYLAGLGGLGLSVAGIVNCKSGREVNRAAGDLRKVSDMSRTTRYYEATKPSTSVLELPKAFDWSLLRDKPDLYPHMMLVGASGGGKSSFAENLAGLLRGDSYGVIPHWQVGEFTSCGRVWCDENNMGNGGGFDQRAFKPRTSLDKWDDMLRAIPVPDGHDPIVTWSELVDGVITTPTVCQVFRAVWFEMRRRYKKGTDGKFIGGERLNLIVDEFNAMANLPGLRKLWLDIVREARKVGITLILIIQQNDVTSLAIDGQGSIRDNLVQISFNTAADDVLLENLRLAESQPLREFWLAKYRAYQLMPYRATVRHDWADLPVPGAWVASYDNVQVKQGTEVEVEDAMVASDAGKGATGHAENRIEYTVEELEEFYRSAVEAANRGMTKPAIINKVWGFKKNFGEGMRLWRTIESSPLGQVVLLPQQNVTNDKEGLH